MVDGVVEELLARVDAAHQLPEQLEADQPEQLGPGRDQGRHRLRRRSGARSAAIRSASGRRSAAATAWPAPGRGRRRGRCRRTAGRHGRRPGRWSRGAV